jgi:uncharacterized hydrophobic protein (TIGR00271 family)
MARRRNVDNETVLRAVQDTSTGGLFCVLTIASGVLATVAFAAGSIPTLLGSMIVAPLFPPLMVVILATAGGQPKLAWRALGRVGFGLALATASAIAAAWLAIALGAIEDREVFLDRSLLEERVRPGWYSAAAGLAAGVAGTLAFLKNKKDSVIGILAAVALVPASSAAGIALYAGDPLRTLGGLIILFVNLGLILGAGLIVVAIAGPLHEEPTAPNGALGGAES